MDERWCGTVLKGWLEAERGQALQATAGQCSPAPFFFFKLYLNTSTHINETLHFFNTKTAKLVGPSHTYKVFSDPWETEAYS